MCLDKGHAIQKVGSIKDGILVQLPMLVFVCVIYALNKLFFSYALVGSDTGWFVTGYLNDLMAPIAFFSLVNISFALSKRCMTGIVPILVLCVTASFFWECLAPAVRPDAVADHNDAICYFVGSVAYYLLLKLSLTKGSSK